MGVDMIIPLLPLRVKQMSAFFWSDSWFSILSGKEGAEPSGSLDAENVCACREIF